MDPTCVKSDQGEKPSKRILTRGTSLDNRLSEIRRGNETGTQRISRTILSSAAVLLVAIILMCSSTIAIISTRPAAETHVKGATSGGALLLTADMKSVVGTGDVESVMPLANVSQLGPHGDYSRVKYVVIERVAGKTQGFTVIGYSWYNYTSMDFHLTPGGITLSMESEGLWLSKTDTDDILSGGAIAGRRLERRKMGWQVIAGAALLYVGKKVVDETAAYWVPKFWDWASEDKEPEGKGDGEEVEEGGGDSGFTTNCGCCYPEDRPCSCRDLGACG